MGAGQHRGRRHGGARRRARLRRARAAAALARAGGHARLHPQRDLDALELLPRQAPAGPRQGARRAAYARGADPHAGQGSDRGRIVGALVRLRRRPRAPRGRARGRRHPARRRAADAPAGGRQDARAAHGRQLCHGRRPADAGRHRCRRAAKPAGAAAQREDCPAQGGLLEHLEHHGRHTETDPGRAGREHRAGARAPALARRLGRAQGRSVT